MEEHLEDVREWRFAIGKAIVCFGEVELVTYQCLAHIPSDKISEASPRLGFTQRIDLIVEILERRRPVSSPIENFVKLLKRARQLASFRNDVAHNPAMLNIFVHKTTGDFSLEHCISSAGGGRIIDLAEVK